MPLITDQLRGKGIPFEILFHQPTSHARDEAHRLGLPLSEVVKTILIETNREYALAVIPASRRLDMHRVREAIGDPRARLATEAEILERFPAYPLGALPPLSGELGIPVYVDPEVAGQDSLVFAISESESIRLKSEQAWAGPTTGIVPLAMRAWTAELDAVGKEVEIRASIEIDEELVRS